MPTNFEIPKLTQRGDFEWLFCLIKRRGILLNLPPAKLFTW